MNTEVNYRIPIITYHSIDESGSVISTSPRVFREQMKRLSEEGCEVVSVDRLIERLNGSETGGFGKLVALTFDDGFQNFYTEAFDVLKRYGFSATVYLVTDLCGKHNDWADNPPELPRSPLLGWEQIEELSKEGVEFGVHTRTHPYLTKLSPEMMKDEIVESKRVLEQSIDRAVRTFAYPYGIYDQEIKKVVEENFMAACSTKLGKIGNDSDFFSLERVDSYYLLNQRIFNALSTGVFDRYLQIRHAMRVFKSLIHQN